MAKWIIVDRSLCDGNGLCVEAVPRHFMLDDNDELHVLEDSVAAEALSFVQRAVQNCPKAALQITEI